MSCLRLGNLLDSTRMGSVDDVQIFVLLLCAHQDVVISPRGHVSSNGFDPRRIVYSNGVRYPCSNGGQSDLN